MIRFLSNTLVAATTIVALALSLLWVRSYFTVDDLTHVYNFTRPCTFDGHQCIDMVYSHATSFYTVNGLFIISHPYVDGWEAGWYHTSKHENAEFAKALSNSIGRSGFYFDGSDASIPLWAFMTAALLHPLAAMFRRLRVRRNRGFEVRIATE